MLLLWVARSTRSLLRLLRTTSAGLLRLLIRLLGCLLLLLLLAEKYSLLGCHGHASLEVTA